MIIPDLTQFTRGILKIQGVIADPEEVVDHSINNHLNSFIGLYGSEYLTRMLGEKIGDAYMEYINNRPEDDSEQIDKWEKLRDLFDSIAPSPLNCYVFFHYVRSNQTQATNLGVTKNNSDNPVVSSNEKMITAWNTMVNMNRYIVRWMYRHLYDYPGWNYDSNMIKSINSFGI